MHTSVSPGHATRPSAPMARQIGVYPAPRRGPSYLAIYVLFAVLVALVVAATAYLLVTGLSTGGQPWPAR